MADRTTMGLGGPMLARGDDNGRGLVAAAVLLTALAAVDFTLGSRLVLIGFYGLGPLVASAFVGPRATALVAGYALALAVAAGRWNDIFWSADHVTRCLVVAGASSLGVWLSHRRVRREAQLRRVTAIADVAQRAVLRAIPTAVGRVAFAARYVSATHEALIGGDLYEVAATPHGVRVIVGDVRGKGIDAVQMASLVLGAFRQAAFVYPDLTDVAAQLNDAVTREINADGGQGHEEDFVTAVIVDFRDDDTLDLVNCGHHPPLMLRDSRLEALSAMSPDTPLGLGPDFILQQHRWRAGDRLLLYTDGLVEARDRRGTFFSMEGAPLCPPEQGLETCLDRLIADLMDHVGGELSDDLALVLAERRPV